MPNSLRHDLQYQPLSNRRGRTACMGTLSAVLFGIFVTSAAAAQPSGNDGDIARRVAPCMACHGKEGRAASDGYYPRIAGKPAGYLYNQLLNFRDGRRRQYPLMTYTVQHLSDTYLLEIARFFAQQQLPYPPPAPIDVSAATLERGRTLATKGDAAKDIPACSACHGEALTGIAPSIPGLLGLPRDYVNSQFGAWREGARRAAAPDCMARIAQRMSVEDISAVSAWLATQPVQNGTPAARLRNRLPLECGSYPQEGQAR